jgi:hypothetical protein
MDKWFYSIRNQKRFACEKFFEYGMDVQTPWQPTFLSTTGRVRVRSFPKLKANDIF